MAPVRSDAVRRSVLPGAPANAPRTENALTGALRTGADAEDFASDENAESSPTD